MQTDAASATAAVVRKQKEYDTFMEIYNRKLKHDLEEMEAGDDKERARAIAAGEIEEEDPVAGVDMMSPEGLMAFLTSINEANTEAGAPVDTLQ